MTLALKDIVYIAVYIVSIAGVFFAFRNKLNNLVEEQNKEKGVIWQDGGRLNLVDHKRCREYRDSIWLSMRKCDSTMEGLKGQLDSMNEKLIKILVKMEMNEKKQNSS